MKDVLISEIRFSSADLYRRAAWPAALLCIVVGILPVLILVSDDPMSGGEVAVFLGFLAFPLLRYFFALLWVFRNWQALLRYRLVITTTEIRFIDSAGTHVFPTDQIAEVLPDNWAPGMRRANPLRLPRGILLSQVPRARLNLTRASLLAAAAQPGFPMVRLGDTVFLPIPAGAQYIMDLCGNQLAQLNAHGAAG